MREASEFVEEGKFRVDDMLYCGRVVSFRFLTGFIPP